ncbi:MAG: hypothetical protein AAF799_20595 [Myxococcota bacterium]
MAGALVTAALVPGEASSAPPNAQRPTGERIAIQAPSESEITARIVAELRFLGFAPEVSDPNGEPTSTDAVAAVIAVDNAGGQVEITIIDRVTGKTVSRTLALDDPDDVDPREVAVRAVELLRASLLEVERAPPPPEAEVEVSAPARRALRRPDPRIALGAGIAVGGAPGGVPVATHARLQVRATPHPLLGVVLVGNVPLHAPTVEAIEGQARVRAGWLGIGPRLALRKPDATVVPALSLTAGVAIIDMQGIPEPGFRAVSTRVADAVFEGAFGLEFAVSPRVRLRLDAAAAACARTIRVRFDGRSVAQWCRPHVLGSAGIGVIAW